MTGLSIPRQNNHDHNIDFQSRNPLNNSKFNAHLTHFISMFLSYIYPLKTTENLTFSGDIQIEHWAKIGWVTNKKTKFPTWFTSWICSILTIKSPKWYHLISSFSDFFLKLWTDFSKTYNTLTILCIMLKNGQTYWVHLTSWRSSLPCQLFGATFRF